MYICDTDLIWNDELIHHRDRNKFATKDEAERFAIDQIRKGFHETDPDLPERITTSNGHLLSTAMRFHMPDGILTIWVLPEEKCCPDDEWE